MCVSEFACARGGRHLPPCALGTKHVNLQVLRSNLNIDVLSLGQDDDGGGAGLYFYIVARNALDPMHTRLELQQLVHALTRNRRLRLLETPNI